MWVGAVQSKTTRTKISQRGGNSTSDDIGILSEFLTHSFVDQECKTNLYITPSRPRRANTQITCAIAGTVLLLFSGDLN